MNVKFVKCQCIKTGEIIDGYSIGGRLFTTTNSKGCYPIDITETHVRLPIGTVQMLKWVLAASLFVFLAIEIFSRQ